MRTTVELSPELLRAAKVSAAQRGESLKALFTRALEQELGRASKGARAEWPLIRSTGKQKRRLTNQRIAEIFAAEDVEAARRSQR